MNEAAFSVSVVIPVFNGARHLAEAIESVFAQTCNDFEIILIDDGSTDGTPEVARTYRHRIAYHRRKHGGTAAARNTGIKLARGAHIAHLDADDVWLRDKLELQACLPHWDQSASLRHYQHQLLPSSLFAPRRVFQRFGGFDESYSHGEDIEWFARARDSGIRMRHLPETLVVKRFHGANLTYRAETDRSHLLRIFRESVHRKESDARTCS